MIESRWFAFEIVIDVLRSLALAASCGDDDADGDCTAFSDAEAGCWEVAGC
ncbi:MAG: hypothetical protein IT350_06410 [Deltaproteobacteria bacterium]|nr:hypothetical protein [Deltaproteobacteria bacterium]